MSRRGDGWQAFMAQHPLAEPSATEEFWVTYLDENPDVLHRLLADIYEATYGADAPPTLDDLWKLMSDQPRYASAPFGEAVIDALGGRSINWLAGQAGVSQSVLSRMVNGLKPVVNIKDIRGSMYRLERIAAVLRVHPVLLRGVAADVDHDAARLGVHRAADAVDWGVPALLGVRPPRTGVDVSAIPTLDDEESYLAALLDDESGVELAEFCWIDEEKPDGCFRLWDFQWVWYRCDDTYQIDHCGRSVGKSVGIQMRAFAFPF